MTEQRNIGFPGNSRGGNGGALDLSNDREQKSRVNKSHQSSTPAPVPGGSQNFFKKNLFTPVQKGQESRRDVRTPNTPKLSPSVVQEWFECYSSDNLPRGWMFCQRTNRRKFRSPEGKVFRSLVTAKQSLDPNFMLSSTKKQISKQGNSSLPLEKTVDLSLISEADFLNEKLISKQGLQQ